MIPSDLSTWTRVHSEGGEQFISLLEINTDPDDDASFLHKLLPFPRVILATLYICTVHGEWRKSQ